MTLAEKLAAKKAAAKSAGLMVAGSGKAEEVAIPPPPFGEQTGRRLAATEESGEIIPMRHGDAAGDAGWRKAAHSLETELCVVIGPGPKDEAWLAIAPVGTLSEGKPPLLLHRLRLVILPGTFEPF